MGSENENIVFTGAIYGDEKDILLRNAYCFCLVSTSEGMSIALLEAMSYHLPIIASDIQANKEVLDEDKAIWVKPENVQELAEAIKKICIYPVDETLLDYNYEKVRNNYTWDKVAEKYIAHLEKLSGKKK